MNITRKSVAKIGIKDIERVWKDRAKGARIILTDRTCPGLELITNADSQSWVRPVSSCAAWIPRPASAFP